MRCKLAVVVAMPDRW